VNDTRAVTAELDIDRQERDDVVQRTNRSSQSGDVEVRERAYLEDRAHVALASIGLTV
jgi:hypothetical protein